MSTIYRIKSKKTNKYITIKDNSSKANNQCILYELNPHKSQTFILNTIENCYIQIIHPSTKQLLTLSEASDQNGAPFIIQPLNKENQDSQRFQIHYCDKNSQEVAIFTYCGKCLDCCEESTKNGTEIIQWDFHGSGNQKWILEKV